MVWQCGIDEAGYGPNLGPFVMTLAAIGLPDELAEADLWHEWSAVVKKAGPPRDDRIIVDDSKAVYSPTAGLGSLERHLLPFLPPFPTNLSEVWTACVLTPMEQRLAEPWHAAELTLPAASARGANWEENEQPRTKNRDLRMSGAASCVLNSPFSVLGSSLPSVCFRSVVVFAPLFNRLVTAANSKAAAPLWALSLLFEEVAALAASAVPSRLALDRLGGRHHYAALLREQFFGCRVDVQEESAARGRYRLGLGNGEWQFHIEPKADQNHFAVALASMFSKYLRELLMHQFNGWWGKQQEGLKPTAGYPVDAKRWWQETATLRSDLAIADHRLWRCR